MGMKYAFWHMGWDPSLDRLLLWLSIAMPLYISSRELCFSGTGFLFFHFHLSIGAISVQLENCFLLQIWPLRCSYQLLLHLAARMACWEHSSPRHLLYVEKCSWKHCFSDFMSFRKPWFFSLTQVKTKCQWGCLNCTASSLFILLNRSTSFQRWLAQTISAEISKNYVSSAVLKTGSLGRL